MERHYSLVLPLHPLISVPSFCDFPFLNSKCLAHMYEPGRCRVRIVWRIIVYPIPGCLCLETTHRKLDPNHPLIKRTIYTPRERSSRGRKPKLERPPELTRLQRAAQLTAACPRPKLLPRRWRQGRLPLLGGKGKGKEIHEHWYSHYSDQELILYSDGSQDRQTGWGFVAYLNGALLHRQHGSLKKAEASMRKL